MNKLGCINKKGFSLVELSISVLILTIISSAVVPNFIIGIRQSAAKKTAIEITQIQEAARKYYIDKNSWPANFTTLASGYLDPTWSATNLSPFGKPYVVSVSGPNLIVQTDMPTDIYLVAGANLQMVNYAVSGSFETVQSTVTPPGSISVLPVGTVVPWPKTVVPAGFLLCDGTVYNISSYPGLGSLLSNTYGGNGVTTFAVPNIQGRTVFGYSSGDPNFGGIGNTGGNTTMIGDGLFSSGHADTFNWFNQVKIANGSLYGMTGGQSNTQGVSTAVLNPYITMNYIIKT